MFLKAQFFGVLCSLLWVCGHASSPEAWNDAAYQAKKVCVNHAQKKNIRILKFKKNYEHLDGGIAWHIYGYSNKDKKNQWYSCSYSYINQRITKFSRI